MTTRFTARLIALLLALGFTVGLSAQSQEDRDAGWVNVREQQEEAPPEPEEVVEIPQETFVRTLDNGLRLILQPIPDARRTAVLIHFATGSAHDPADAPGLNDLLFRLVASCAISGRPDSPRTPQGWQEQYRWGWQFKSYPTQSVMGLVVDGEATADAIAHLAAMVTGLTISAEDLSTQIGDLAAEEAEVESGPGHLTPIRIITARAFPHSSGYPGALDLDALKRLDPARIMDEWHTRACGHNLTVVVSGAMAEDRSALEAALDSAFASLPAGSESPLPVTRRAAGPGVTQETSAHLPGDDDHVAAAFFAPPISSEEHPAFLTVAMLLEDYAKSLPGVKVRLPFQYALLLDERAAWLTPHAWRFPKGAGQALGFWKLRIDRQPFSATDSRKVLRAIGWQLGGPMSEDFIRLLRSRPALLFSVAQATAWRARHGDEAFWNEYRERLQTLTWKQLSAARSRFFHDENRRLVILRAE